MGNKNIIWEKYETFKSFTKDFKIDYESGNKNNS